MTRSPFQRLRDGVAGIAYGNPLYALMLGGPSPNGLAVAPPDPWPGDVKAGQELLRGAARFAGKAFPLDPRIPGCWTPVGASPRWLAAAHGFDWLRDLRAVSGDDGRRCARALIDAWIEEHGQWNAVAWTPAALGRRISNWIGLHDFYCASADDEFRARVFDSLGRQTRHLARILPGGAVGPDLIVALKGLVYSAVCLRGKNREAEEPLKALVRELHLQILPDGGHVERCPTVQAEVLRHLIDVRAVLRAARAETPEALQYAIDRMTPALRFFRHGDGGSALFNSAREGDAALLEAIVAQADSRGRPLKSATHTGFERLIAGRTLVLMDVGAPAPPGADVDAYAGVLSLEASVGKERLIVNCGAHPSRVGAWRQALAATAAHSTVTVGDTNSSEVLPDGGLGRRPTLATCERQELDAGAVLVVATHDGYAQNFGLLHRRRIYLADSGEDLRGEDTLEPVLGSRPPPQPFAVRFHLHPNVTATMNEAGDAVLLKLPVGGVWRLHARGGAAAIQDSIYLGHGEDPRPTRQVVVTGRTGAEPVTVKWALRRERKPG
jgi:uncharacterized heparinase superfamily protein